MQCPSCGGKINDYENICPCCGEILRKNEPKKESTSATFAKPKTVAPRQMSENPIVERFFNFFNFDNVGLKIQKLAKWVCWIEIIFVLSVCAVLFLVSIFNEALRSLFWVWPLIAVIAPFMIWVGSWFLFSIGKLIENDDKKTKSQKIIADKLEKK